MTDNLLTRTQVVVSCPDCEYERTFEERNKRVSGAVAGHSRSADCDGQPTITVETLLVCRSCGYDARDGATVTATDGRYVEDTLCEVCRDHRDECRVETGVAWLVDA
jgi:hypothetical protein